MEVSAFTRIPLLTRSPPSAREGALCAVFMFALAFAVYGTQVKHGGFLIDDWYIASQYQVPAHSGFDIVRTYMSTYGQRPVSALYLLATQAVFGLHMSAFLAWSVVLAAFASTLLFILLRQLGIERIHAAAIAALVLVFPTADSTVLWIDGSNAHVNVALYLAGAIVALHGLRKAHRSAMAWHSAAVVLYLLSMLFAETTAGLVLLSVFLYRLRTTWRSALRLWAMDALAVVVAVAYVGSHTQQRVVSAHDQVSHATELFKGARRIVELAGLAYGHTRIPGVAIAGIAVLATIAWRVLPRSGAVRAELGRWLVVAGGGVVAIAAGYIAYVPSASYYVPGAQGLGNRVNALAAPGFIVLLYALAVLIGLVFRGLHWGRLVSTAVTLVLAAAVAATWTGPLRKDEAAYARAFAIAEQSLHVLDRRVPKPPHFTTIYTFGLPKETEPVVPVWDASWDLTGAVRILWHDHTLKGVPSPTISDVRCNRGSIEPIGGLYSGRSSDSSYGKAIFVFVPSGQVRVIRNRTACEAARRRYVEVTIRSLRSLPRAISGHPYLRQLRASGGTGPYTWLVTGGTLPSGMSLLSTGQLVGTVGTAGVFRFAVTVTDSAQAPAKKTARYTLRVVGKR
jgi:hypothetical protein